MTTGAHHTVTINVRGREPLTLSGRVPGEGDHGGTGDGVPITSFDGEGRSSRQQRVLATFDVEPGLVAHEKWMFHAVIAMDEVFDAIQAGDYFMTIELPS